MASIGSSDEKWYFSKERLENTPSKQCGIEAYKELSYRQQAANFIQDMGQRLKVSQLCINTAIVYMHRFYVFHSFTQFPWHSIASASIFLAAKVEEQPRKLEHVIRVANHCKNPQHSVIETTSDRYQAQSQDLVFNENVLLQTLGFDVAIDHPHTHVVKCCQLVRASKDLAQTSYFMASNSLHLTTMCLQYKPTVVACFCIHLVCKWSNWEIPLSNEKREWFSYVDPSVTGELLQQLTEEFLAIFERCPSRLKEKIMAIGEYSPFESDKKSSLFSDSKDSHHRPYHDIKPGSTTEDAHKHRSSRPHDGSSGSQSQTERDYRDKRETERVARHASSKPSQGPSSAGKQPVPHGHHRPPIDPKLKQHGRPLGHPPTGRPDPHRDILKEATRDIGLRDYRELADSSSAVFSSLTREISRDLQVRNNSEKDVLKREFLLKTNVSKSNSFSNSNADKRTTDPSRSRPVDPNKILPKHDSTKPYLKAEIEIKKHLSSSAYDKSSAFLSNKSVNSTSRKMESSFAPDASSLKSVLKQNLNMPLFKQEHNGNISFPALPFLEDTKTRLDFKVDSAIPPPIVKKPSLFSPQKSPPPKRLQTPPTIDTFTTSQLPLTVLPFDSPVGSCDKRSRTVSTSSEPELRPVMKKIDQVEGFENLLRDSSIGIKVNHQVPDIITPITDVKAPEKEVTEPSLSKDLRPPDLIPPFLSQPIVNGIETNPTLISNLLKETPKVPHLPTISSPVQKDDKEHKEKDYHKERKKKSKEKHKHKDKDKDRSKEDREKKKKHKDKDREKYKNREPVPIKITISKDKIHPPDPPPVISKGLKIKIPKDRIKADNIGETSHPPGGSIKIKISKDVINFGGDSKKRERERASLNDAPPNKISKSSYNRMTSESKQNGRNSYNKVAQVGDGEVSVHRLAESKYINKGASA